MFYIYESLVTLSMFTFHQPLSMEINNIFNCPKNTESFVKKIRHETNSLKILTNSVKYHLEKINQSNIVKQNISPRRTKECQMLKVDLVEELYSQ